MPTVSVLAAGMEIDHIYIRNFIVEKTAILADVD